MLVTALAKPPRPPTPTSLGTKTGTFTTRNLGFVTIGRLMMGLMIMGRLIIGFRR